MEGPNLRIHGLDHVVLRTAQLEPMIRFYCDVLGCSVERTLDELGLVQLRAGASLIDLVDVHGPIGRTGGDAPGQGARNLDHFCIRVDAFDVESLRASLATVGVTVGDDGRRYGAEGFGVSLYIEDPDGNVVELKGPAEPGSKQDAASA